MAETTHLIEVAPQDPGTDPASRSVLAEARHLGASPLRAAARSRLYRLTGPLSPEDARRIAQELLSDPITETWTLLAPSPSPLPPGEGTAELSPLPSGDGTSRVRRTGEGASQIDIWYKPSVTDPAAWVIGEALKGLGYAGVRVRCGTRVRFYGAVIPSRLATLAGKFLGNAVMQDWEVAPL